MMRTHPTVRSPRRFACTAAIVVALCAPRALAQPTFSTLVLQDHAPADPGEPRPPDIAADGSVFVTRTSLSPAARARLAAALGHDHILTIDPGAPGPAMFSQSRLMRLPGDRRLRGELSADIAIGVLGHGATIAESEAAAQHEPRPRGILVGAHPNADPPAGWQRVGDATFRPVVWTRQVEIHGDRLEGDRRILGLMDDWPMASGFGGFVQALHAQPFAPLPRSSSPLVAIAADPKSSVYWSWPDHLVKTTITGEVLADFAVEGATHGDLTWHAGHVAVLVTETDATQGDRVQVHVLSDATLERVASHPLPECRHRAAAICWIGDRYLVIEQSNHAANVGPRVTMLHEYDAAFRHLRDERLPIEWDDERIVHATHAYGRIWLRTEREHGAVLIASEDLRHLVRVTVGNPTLGMIEAPFGMLFCARQDASASYELQLVHPHEFSR